MKVATLDLTPELFLGISKGFKGGGWLTQFIVKENPLPDDATIVKISLSVNRPDTLRLFVHSDSFVEVPEGVEPPELPLITFETVFSVSERERLMAIEGCDKCELCDEHGDHVEANAGKHQAVSQYSPICRYCGLADIAGDWGLYPCNDEWRKVIATQP